MGEPYIGEIRMFGGNFAPAGWAFCNGAPDAHFGERRVVQLSSGRPTAATGRRPSPFPTCRAACPFTPGRAPASRRTTARREGGRRERDVDDSADPDPHARLRGQHGCGLFERSERSSSSRSRASEPFTPQDSTTTNLAPTAVSPVGGSQPHDNMAPYLCINFIISLFGVFPTADLRRNDHVRSICRRDPDVRRELRADRLGAVQRPAPADLAEHGALLVARHRSTAATASPRLRCRTCKARRPSAQGQGAGLSDYDLGQQGGTQFVTLL